MTASGGTRMRIMTQRPKLETNLADGQTLSAVPWKTGWTENSKYAVLETRVPFSATSYLVAYYRPKFLADADKYGLPVQVLREPSFIIASGSDDGELWNGYILPSGNQGSAEQMRKSTLSLTMKLYTGLVQLRTEKSFSILQDFLHSSLMSYQTEESLDSLKESLDKLYLTPGYVKVG